MSYAPLCSPEHLVHARDLSRSQIEDLFALAHEFEAGSLGEPLKRKILATLFFEPSTRTRFSFESAMYRLGGSVISTENGREFSSVAKGETIEDTIRVMSSYADAIVMRHFESGAADRAVSVSSVPVINAGDGSNQHPTQALLDLYTIDKELGSIDGRTITIVGDLKNGRTVKSLLWTLSRYRDVTIVLVSPPALALSRDFLEEVTSGGHLRVSETTDLVPALGQADVLYQTRIQKERFSDAGEYEKYKGTYKIGLAEVKTMKKGGILLHPLPRVDEISSEVDHLNQAAYFRQAQNGLYVRMAILNKLLG